MIKLLLKILAISLNALAKIIKSDAKPIPLCSLYGKYGLEAPAFVGHVTAPSVSTNAATGVTKTQITANGDITNTGGANPTVRGFCYIVGSGTPTIANNVVNTSGSFGTGAYSQNITGLSAGTLYSVRAYATNSAGTGYGATIEVYTVANTLAESVVEGYNGNVFDTSVLVGFGSNRVVANEQLELTVLGSGANYKGIETINRHQLSNSFFYAELVDAGNQSLSTIDVQLSAYLTVNVDQVLFGIEGNTLRAIKRVNGASTTLGSIAYNNTNQRFLRMRSNGTTLFWEYSANGSSWTTLHSETHPFSLDAVVLQTVAGAYGTNGSDTTVIWDNINQVGVSVTKVNIPVPATYRVLSKTAVTKAATYRVKTTPSPVVKTAAYGLKKVELVTKPAEYRTYSTQSTQVPGAYLVQSKTSLQIAAEYVVVQRFSQTKAAEYKVQAKNNTPKSAQYAVQAPTAPLAVPVTYRVKTSATAQISANYAIRTTVGVQLSASYQIKTSEQVAKSTEYRVQAPTTPVSKAAAYRIETATSIQVPAAYVLGGQNTTAVPATYRIITTSGLQLSAAYIIVKRETEQVPASYATKRIETETKPAEYVVKVVAQETKSTQYSIQKEYLVTKPVTYVVGGGTALAVPASYTIRQAVTLQKPTTYHVRNTHEMVVGANYYVRRTEQQLVPAAYVIDTPPILETVPSEYRINKTENTVISATYEVDEPSFVQVLPAQYAIQWNNPVSPTATPISPAANPFNKATGITAGERGVSKSQSPFKSPPSVS